MSVSLSNSRPSAISSSRSGLKFSMIPLWTSATAPTMCGCALPTVGAPCVAQRVWAMPVAPCSGFSAELAREIVELALGAAALELAIVDRADAGGVIAAIFEPLEPVEQPLRDVRSCRRSRRFRTLACCNSFDRRRRASYASAEQSDGGCHVAHIKNRRKRGVAVWPPGASEPTMSADAAAPPASYYDNSGHPDAWSGGARKITISTPKGPHQVWVKRVGNNPKLKLLLLTGGPGLSHAYLEVMDSYPARRTASNIIITTSSRPARATGRTIPTCGRSPATSTRSTRSGRRSAATRTTSACSGTAGAGCWRWNMRSPTRTR